MKDRLKELRLERKLSQKQVAEYLGISTRAYSHYEIGDREPSISLLVKLCDLFEVTADYMIGRADNY